VAAVFSVTREKTGGRSSGKEEGAAVMAKGV